MDPELPMPESTDTSPYQTPEIEKDTARTRLSDAAADLLQAAGSALADRISSNHQVNPDVRAMLRDFGLLLQDTATTIRPPGAPAPGYQREGYSGIDGFRQRMNAAGVNPDNMAAIGVGVLDHHQGDQSHGSMVAGVIGDPNFGLSHGAKTIAIECGESPFRPIDPANESPEHVISELFSSGLKTMAEKLQRACAEGQGQNMRVLNVSLGMNAITIAQGIVGRMLNEPEKFKPWLQQLLGDEGAAKWTALASQTGATPESQQLDKQLYEALLSTIDKQLRNDESVQAAKQEYQAATKQVADSGVTVIVAASNSQNALASIGVVIPPGAGFNQYAQSDHVIAVGACDLNATPDRNSDDYVAGFSAHGTGRHNPTVVAHGSKVDSPHEGINGTSFAAPLLAATVGLMLAQNPDLRFDDIKKILTQNASRLRNTPTEAQGAGELNVDQAVLAARAWRRTEKK